MKYVSLAKEASRRKDYGSGLRYVRIALELEPENQELNELREKYKGKADPIKRLIDNEFG